MKISNIVSYYGGNIKQVKGLELISLVEFIEACKSGGHGKLNHRQIIDPMRDELKKYKSPLEVPKVVWDKLSKQKNTYLPYYCPSITGPNGGGRKDDCKHTGLVQIDIDYKDNPQLVDEVTRRHVKEKINSLLNCVLAATSPNGFGVKALFYVGETDTPTSFKARWRIIKKYVVQESGLVVDDATCAPNSAFYFTYDPEVLADENREMISWDNLLEFVNSVGTVNMEKEQKPIADKNEKYESICDDLDATLAKATVCVNQLIAQEIDITSSYAKWIATCFSLATLGEDGRELWQRVCSNHPKYDRDECNKKYDECLEKYDGKRTIASFFYECEREYGITSHILNQTNHIPEPQHIPAAPKDSLAPAIGNLLASPVVNNPAHDQIVSPYLLSPQIEDQLPLSISRVTTTYTDQRKKDIMFLGLVTGYSGLFPNLKVATHNNAISNTNLALLIIAPPGSGKGALSEVKSVFSEIDECIKERSAQEWREWNNDDSENKGPAPKNRRLLIPLNSSSPAIIDLLVATKGMGIMLETEMGVMGNTLGKDWGNIIPLLCKNFHNEGYEVARKNSGYIQIPRPCFSSILSTTFPVALKLVTNEDGLASRQFMYIYENNSDIDAQSFNFERAFEQSDILEAAGAYARNVYENFSVKPDVVYAWPKKAQPKLVEFFRAMRRDQLKIFGPAIESHIRRMTLKISRLGAIFAFLDDYENHGCNYDVARPIQMIPVKYVDVCLSLAQAFMWHLRTYIENMPKSNNSINSKLNRCFHILQFLPHEFTIEQLGADLCEKIGISPKTRERRIADCCELGFLIKVRHGLYRKTEKCPE